MIILASTMPIKPRKRTNLIDKRYNVRFDAGTAQFIEKAAQEEGLKNGYDYIRQLVQREQAGQHSGLESLEAKIAATLDRQSRRLAAIETLGSINAAATLTLAQQFFRTVPPPGREMQLVLDAALPDKNTQYLKQIGIGLKGKWLDAMKDLSATLDE